MKVAPTSRKVSCSMLTGECLFPLESALFHQPATVDASIDLAKMVKKWSSSKTIMQNDTYRVLTLRLVVWTLTLPQVRKAPGTPAGGVPGAVYDEYLSTAPHGVSVYSLRILTFAPGCH